MRTVKYGVHTIKSFPTLHRTFRRWKIGVTICSERDGITTMRRFQPESSWPTEEHADIFGINYARQIIDGKVPGVSING